MVYYIWRILERRTETRLGISTGKLDEVRERRRRNIERDTHRTKGEKWTTTQKDPARHKKLRCDQGRGSGQGNSGEQSKLRLCNQVAQGYAHPSFVRSLMHGPTEDKVEGHDAYRVCLQ